MLATMWEKDSHELCVGGTFIQPCGRVKNSSEINSVYLSEPLGSEISYRGMYTCLYKYIYIYIYIYICIGYLSHHLFITAKD